MGTIIVAIAIFFYVALVVRILLDLIGERPITSSRTICRARVFATVLEGGREKVIVLTKGAVVTQLELVPKPSGRLLVRLADGREALIFPSAWTNAIEAANTKKAGMCSLRR